LDKPCAVACADAGYANTEELKKIDDKASKKIYARRTTLAESADRAARASAAKDTTRIPHNMALKLTVASEFAIPSSPIAQSALPLMPPVYRDD